MSARPLPVLLVKVGGFALLGALLLLCVISKASTRVFTWPWVFYAQLLLLAPIFLCAWVRARSVSAGAVFAGLCLGLGASVWFSRNPAFSFESTLILWSGIAFTWWLAHTLEHRLTAPDEAVVATARFIGLLLLAPVLSSLGLWVCDMLPGMIQARGLGEVVQVLGNFRNTHPFGHGNYTGAYALLVIPWFAALVPISRGWRRKGWQIATALGLLLVYSSSSRGVILGLLALIACALGLGFAVGKLNRRQVSALFGAAIIAAIVIVMTNARLRSIILDPDAFSRPNSGDIQRLGMAQAGWLLGLERPWIGHGPGMVPFVYPEVRAQLLGGVETSYQLHNAWLHLWVTTGLLGLAGIAAFVGILTASCLRWLRQPASSARTLALASASTLVGYAVFAVTDYQLDVIGIVAALALHAAVVLAAPRPRPAHQLQKFTGILPLVFGLTAVVVLIPAWRARQLHWEAWALTPQTHAPALRAALARAAEAAPGNTHYQNQFAFQLARDARLSQTPADRAAARAAFARTLNLDPAQEPVHAALGWLWLPDDPREAASAFDHALSLLPDRPTLHLGLALSQLGLGRTRDAVDALALECLVNPAFVTSPLWTQSPLQSLFPAVMKRFDDLCDQATRHPRLPRWRQPDVAYARAFARWWAGGAAPSREELTSASAPQRDFFTALASPNPSWPDPWRALARATADPAHAETLLKDSEPPIPPLAIVGALARLSDPSALFELGHLVRGSAPRNAAVTRTLIERSHYSLMHRNLDGPGYPDLNPRFADAFTLYFAGPLFPIEGMLPGPVLTDLRVGKPAVTTAAPADTGAPAP